MPTKNHSLAELTKSYWHLSLCWNGRRRNNYSLAQALTKCNIANDNLNSQRPLAKAYKNLHADIVKNQQSSYDDDGNQIAQN